MDSKLQTAKEILRKNNQEHLLSFYDEIDDAQKNLLLEQILSINFEKLNSLYKNSFIEDENVGEVITHLPHIDKSKLSPEEIDSFKQIGINSIKRGEFAVITLSGGQRNKTWTFPDPKELSN